MKKCKIKKRFIRRKSRYAIVDDLFKWAGSQQALAEICGIKQQSVHEWKKRGIPINQAILIAHRSEGEFTLTQLCPQIFTQKEIKCLNKMWINV